MREAVAKVGPAITASAATVIVGIAMMGFADFSKIRQAGLGIAFCLAMILLSALTLVPALLCLIGRWALWPRHQTDQPDAIARHGERFWTRVGHAIAQRPGLILLATCAVLAPGAVVALMKADAVSYDVTRNLPSGAPSATGIQKLRAHFPAGETGPVTVLLKNESINFGTPGGVDTIKKLTDQLLARAGELHIADVRSVAQPLGTSSAARDTLTRLGQLGAGTVREQAAHYYVGGSGHVTRIEVVLSRDPLTEAGLYTLGDLERVLQSDVSAGVSGTTEVRFFGSAAAMRDLKVISTHDRKRVDWVVVSAVFVVLLVLLRRPVLSAYLILTVVFGYLTTLGLTYLFFQTIERGPFPGLDWKVPLFLFTILVAVGEDYNIFLITRVHEEEQRLGEPAGVTTALGKTGGVITSCGLIMAGTFASLFAGTLWEMTQMGFALCLGVLLDTLIVRPVLVPSFLQFVHHWRGGTMKTAFA